ncbi:MAG TPA: hypothetical protein VKN74_05270, partial [Candidatus Mcinerneyibacterium sp.]|nr:hypothetical protein [Candidatus Mcinerneyibacterium sp.]
MDEEKLEKFYNDIVEKYELKKKKNKERLKIGINQVFRIWEDKDGTEKEMIKFCMRNFIKEEELHKYTQRIQKHYESIYGHLNTMRREMLEPIHLKDYEPLKIDYLFSSFNLYPVVDDIFYEKKISFFIALNYKIFSLDEKNTRIDWWEREDWVKANLADNFRVKEPKNIKKKLSDIMTKAEMYISNYNINTSILIDNRGRKLYKNNKNLISHWGLRDEIKSQYKNKSGLKKQRVIYRVIERIVDQTIPEEVINNTDLRWDVDTNILNSYDDFKKENRRYEILLDYFKNMKKLDKSYDKNNNTAIKRNFNQNVRLNREKIINEFEKILNSENITKIANIIKEDLGRDLEPFDIWYDNFKTDGSFTEKELDKITKEKYPTVKEFKNDLPNIINKMGFDEKNSKEIANKIEIDRAKGSGHAWGSSLRGEPAHLRTRFDDDGMNYKGYNIAIHELGHNVEQVISLYHVDNYLLSGVPNTAFSEAFAFIFQKNDLRILDKTEKLNENILKKLWTLYEIIGVALTEIKIWEWMYDNPDTTVEKLKTAAVQISKDVWNEYYAKNFGVVSSPILGIYSHMINYPLYLVNYPLGHIIESMIADYIENKSFGKEMLRMCEIGNLTPTAWMKEAVD